MKILISFGIFLITYASFASADLSEKIKSLDEEIAKAKELVKSGENVETYQGFLKELQTERDKYAKLSKQKKQPSDQLSTDPSVQKTLPKALIKKVDAQKEIGAESIPLNKRYEINQRKISTTRGILITLKSQPHPSDTTLKFIQSEEIKLAQLEKQKVDYEIQLAEIEEAEYLEFRKSSLRVGAMLDFYYQYDFNRPDNSQPLPNRNYNRRVNDFTLNLLELNVHKSFKNVDIYADLDFGDFAEQNSAHNNDPNTHHIGQAFLRYKIPDLEGVTLTAGKFYSHVGLEVAKSMDNRNYSRPYSFTRGIPFWHEGVSIYKSGLGPFGVGLYYYDMTDTALENNTGKDVGTQISFTQDEITSYFNFITGAETPDEGNMRTIYEWNMLWNAKKTLAILFDITYGTEKDATTDEKDKRWLGLVGYIDYNLFNKDYLCLRVENFKDLTSKDAASNMFDSTNSAIDDPADIMSYTLTNRYNLKNGSEVRLEWRTDKASEEIYPSGDGKFNDKQDTLTVAWLYAI